MMIPSTAPPRMSDGQWMPAEMRATEIKITTKVVHMVYKFAVDKRKSGQLTIVARKSYYNKRKSPAPTSVVCRFFVRTRRLTYNRVKEFN